MLPYPLSVPVSGFPLPLAKYLAELVDGKGRIRPADPIEIDGDLGRFISVAAISKFRPSFAHWILSLSEDAKALRERYLRRLVCRFVRLQIGGLPWNRVAYVAYFHERAQGCDIHVLIAKECLFTGRLLPLFGNKKADYKVLNVWRRFENLATGLTDPGDLWCRRYFSPIPKAYTPTQRRLFRALDLKATEKIRSGEIRSHADLLFFFIARGMPSCRPAPI